jgi:aspartate aminotransferase-like enzyme
MIKKYLVAPGPTTVPEEVLLEIAKPVMHHRTTEFSAIFAEVREGLKAIFGTSQDVLILLSSGTAAMEAAVTNTLSLGDRMLVIDAGKFGARWEEIGMAYGLKVDAIKYEWGQSAKVADVEKHLQQYPDTKAVFMQGSETSTTACHPVKEIAAVMRKHENTILVVDAITSAGVYDTRMDEWGIDIMVSGSQKAFMLPPGLAFITLSEKAWAKTKTSTLPKYYLDLNVELKNQKKDTTAWTPGVNLIYGLNKALKMMKAEGLENVYKRHAVCAEATRKALIALGLKLLAEDSPSNAATGVYMPDGIDATKFEDYMREKIGITFAGGQDHLKGKIIRVSHLGYHDYFDTVLAISAIEMGLKAFGHNIMLGKGMAACEEVLAAHMPKA